MFRVSDVSGAVLSALHVKISFNFHSSQRSVNYFTNEESGVQREVLSHWCSKWGRWTPESMPWPQQSTACQPCRSELHRGLAKWGLPRETRHQGYHFLPPWSFSVTLGATFHPWLFMSSCAKYGTIFLVFSRSIMVSFVIIFRPSYF